jgi:hypothetical protein
MRNYTIAVMTFVHRYEPSFLPLFREICRQRPEKDKIVFVNGQYKEAFHQDFRKNILEELSKHPNTYVHMSPQYRGFSHMVNTCINTAATTDTLILSDDNRIAPSFFDFYEGCLGRQPRSFLLSGQYAHFSIHRDDIKEVGWFDERLLGMGEEDGEWDFRYSKFHNVPNSRHMGVPIENTNTIWHENIGINGDSVTNKNTKIHSGKYSVYNRDFMMARLKFEEEWKEGEYTRQGPYGRPVQIHDDVPNYYPGQLDFWENGDKL